MATTDAFNERIEAAIKKLLLEEYPHIKTTSLNRIGQSSARHVACTFSDESRADCGGVRSLKFFDLPREIRDLIYEHAVTPSDGLCVPLNDCEPTEECIWNDELWEHFCGRKLGVIKHNGLELQPAVTRACQQMRREALPIFYKLNDFAVCLAYSRYLHDTPGIKFLLSWLKAIGTKNTSNLRRLTIHYTREADKQAILDMKTILEEHTEFILIKRVR